jgi:hypothetical protein
MKSVKPEPNLRNEMTVAIQEPTARDGRVEDHQHWGPCCEGWRSSPYQIGIAIVLSFIALAVSIFAFCTCRFANIDLNLSSKGYVCPDDACDCGWGEDVWYPYIIGVEQCNLNSYSRLPAGSSKCPSYACKCDLDNQMWYPYYDERDCDPTDPQEKELKEVEKGCDRRTGLLRVCGLTSLISYPSFQPCPDDQNLHFTGPPSVNDFFEGALWRSSVAFGALAIAAGSIVLIVEVRDMAIRGDEGRHQHFGVLLIGKLMSAVFIGLTLLALDSGICNEQDCVEKRWCSEDPFFATFGGGSPGVEMCADKCRFSYGAGAAIAACGLWAVSGLLSGYLREKGRTAAQAEVYPNDGRDIKEAGAQVRTQPRE